MLGEPLALEEVTAVIVTRGDCPEAIEEISQSLIFPRGVIWDNSQENLYDYKAFGRYAAMALPLHAPFVSTPVVYTQDDDCIVSKEAQWALVEAYEDGKMISNMPSEHNAGHPLLALPGWGSLFDRALPLHAFAAWMAAGHSTTDENFYTVGCDIVFPVLSDCVRIDAGHTDLPHSGADNRTHRQPEYLGLKQWYYDEAAKLRDVT